MDARLSQTEACRLAADGAEYRSVVTVRAERLQQALGWNSGGRSALTGGAGDWLLTDGDARWTITDEAFLATYAPRDDGLWHKPAPVRAVRVHEPVDVETTEGVSHADAGDWLVTAPGAGAWPVDQERFVSSYRRVG